MDQLAAMIPKEQLPALEELKIFWGKYLAGITETNEWKGARFPSGFSGETAKYVYEEWDMPENAVFIFNYPKTGITWTSEIVRQILYSHDPNLDQLTKSLSIYLSRLVMGPPSKFKMFDCLPLQRRFFASHLSEELFNFTKMKKKNGKLIYIIRNPKDQAVSSFHFIKKVPAPDDMQTSVDSGWNSFIDNYMQGKMSVFTKPGEWYPDHILGWLKHKEDKDVLILIYEEMKMDLPKQVRRIAEFMNVELTNHKVSQIVDRCSFSSMKEALKDDPVCNNIARKGEVGDWKNYFTVTQSERMDKIIEEKLGYTGLKFIYDL